MATFRKGSKSLKKEGVGGVESTSSCTQRRKQLQEQENEEIAKDVAAVPRTSSIDRWLQGYVQFTSKAILQDKVLKLVQYSLWMLSRFYGKESFVKLSGEISWARYITRLFGLPNAIEAVRSGSWGSPKALGKAMAWTMVAYYPLEHLAYLKWKAPKLIATKRKRFAAKASAWSCRFWFAYIVLDLVRSRLALKNKTAALSIQRSERLQIFRNALFCLPSLHWSLPNWDTDPWLSDELVNGLMWLESLVCMYQAVS